MSDAGDNKLIPLKDLQKNKNLRLNAPNGVQFNYGQLTIFY